jgi:hypothetical protein
MLPLKIPPHRRRPVPVTEMDPGLRREKAGGDAALIQPYRVVGFWTLNHLIGSEH